MVPTTHRVLYSGRGRDQRAPGGSRSLACVPPARRISPGSFSVFNPRESAFIGGQNVFQKSVACRHQPICTPGSRQEDWRRTFRSQSAYDKNEIDMKYKAKIDWWIGASVVIGLVAPVAVAATEKAYWVYALAVVVWVLVFGFCFPQSYETTATALVIRAGLSKRTIPYSNITAIRHSSDSRSALALSLDRVQIEYASGEQLIAPKNQQAFWADLESRAPQLSRRGQDLVVKLA